MTQSVSRAALAAAPVSNENSTPENASNVAPPAPNVPSFLRGYADRVVQRRAHLMRERELLARPPKSPASDPRTLAADAEPQTLSAKLSVPFNWVLNHFADSHALEKMKEDDAVSMFSGLKRASRSETLQRGALSGFEVRALAMARMHYRSQSLWMYFVWSLSLLSFLPARLALSNIPVSVQCASVHHAE
jgi:hypothetical protein